MTIHRQLEASEEMAYVGVKLTLNLLSCTVEVKLTSSQRNTTPD
jgi:hypothetical protein